MTEIGSAYAYSRNPLWREGRVVSSLLCLSLFLLMVPLALSKPGMPPNLKADEGAYYGMALSLGHDVDLRYEVEDSQRFFDEFPYRFVRNVVLMSDDGWSTVYYGKPHHYALAAAPFARLAGGSGMVFFNMLLFLCTIWMSTLFLARRMAPVSAALFSVGFFLLSATFRYVFWLQPEIFNLFCIGAALFFGFERQFSSPRSEGLLLFSSGFFLAVAAYGKPMYLAVALPLVAVPLLGRLWRRVIFFGLGFVVAMTLLASSSLLLTGRASAYLSGEGGARQGMTVCAPDSLPPEVAALRAASKREALAREAASLPPDTDSSTTAAASPTGNSFSWLLRVPQVGGIELLQNVGYFLWGRHAGLLPYFPFSLIALGSFFLFSRGSLARWLLLLSMAMVALYFLLWIGWNWQGGGGFIGNRYYVSMVVGFVFLVEQIRMRWLLVMTTVAGLLVGPLVFTPLGAGVPEPTMQFHTRNAPLRYLPLELSLRNVPGYHRVTVAGLRVRGRSDQILPQGESIWLHGASTTELHMLSEARLDEGLSVLITSPVAPNRVVVEMGGADAVFEVNQAGQGAVFKLRPEPLKKLRQYGTAQYVYRLTAKVERGQISAWTRHHQPPPCDSFAYDETTRENFYRGATITLLGAPEALERDVFAAEVTPSDEAGLPRAMNRSEIQKLDVEVKNMSSVTWPTAANSRGAARVKIAYHWFRARAPGASSAEPTAPDFDREEAVVWDGRRTEIPGDLAPGSTSVVRLEVEAPATPGSYWLVIEPVFEHVGWFSEHSDDSGSVSGNSLSTLVVVEG